MFYRPTWQPHSQQAKKNREEMLDEITRIRTLEQNIIDHSNRAKSRFEKKGKRLPRERLSLLLDKGRPFLELSTLAGYQMHDDDGKKDIAGGGNIIGIGYVSNTRCIVAVHDSAIKGGSISPMGLQKSLRAQEIALENKLPMVSLVESGGANLLYQSELFVNGGRAFYNQAKLSAAGIPQITIVHGSSTAGGAYMPGLSDTVIMVKEKAEVYLAGPPLVKAAIHEDADAQELGGAEMHATITGSADYVAENDDEAIAMARECVAQLGWQQEESSSVEYESPKFHEEEILGLVPVNYRLPYDCRELIVRLVDASEFAEFKKDYGSSLVCGHAMIQGHRVGIIANNGPIDPEGANKATHFIQQCCQRNTPIVYLHNISGYMVGLRAEQGGIVKNGSKMIQAVSNATVPQISILVGGSFGAGNYGMCGRAFSPRFIFAWPNAKISVMGGAQAAKVLEIITVNGLGRHLKGFPKSALQPIAEILKLPSSQWDEEIAKVQAKNPNLPISKQGLTMLATGVAQQIKKMKIPVDMKSDVGVLQQMISFIENKFDAESTSLYATARIWDDGIIDPRDTRRVLGECLSVCKEADQRKVFPNSFGVARM